MKRRGFFGVCAAIALAPLAKLLPTSTAVGKRTVTWVSPATVPVVYPGSDFEVPLFPDAYAVLEETTRDGVRELRIDLPVATDSQRWQSRVVAEDIAAWKFGGPWPTAFSPYIHLPSGLSLTDGLQDELL